MTEAEAEKVAIEEVAAKTGYTADEIRSILEFFNALLIFGFNITFEEQSKSPLYKSSKYFSNLCLNFKF